ncbi:MAG: rane or secreted protein, partial [Segetibacter sp.]|nr:rane or secreted protein [Segetibacter sp.]
MTLFAKRFFLLMYLSLMCSTGEAQMKKLPSKNLVFVDKNGVLRYTKNNAEAAFFGVNYTVPFAYGYRSVKRTGITVEKAIDEDVYHMARLGLDAFRVHVWDAEISDSLGNLLDNEHLRLFDYLLSKLKERNIKILITPIAFWGNGYPEKDEPTHSFSNIYGKGPSVVNENAIKAQENYLKQFFTHVNPYTKLTYKDDPDVIATELNNEPHHSGSKEKTTEYINRLAAAVRSTWWTKPVFYNISESPAYSDAVVKANVDGHSFQWYPTGLVANHTLQGNFLPNVDKYNIPFDSIPTFRNRAKMVYEFDAGDVLQSNMYPAMARSFRSAGFQWATQFAYDPMATAYANTEYQTHYLNLAYTPSKAISFM